MISSIKLYQYHSTQFWITHFNLAATTNGIHNTGTKETPIPKLIDKCVNLGFLAPTIVNASNEVLVGLFLKKKIKFLDIVRIISKIFRDKDFKKYATRDSESIKDIQIADNWARLKTLAMCVR